MISQTAEYALRAVVHLAANPKEAQTARQVADATCAPLAYVSKVLQELVRAGVVHGQRGPHGGFTLLIPIEELTVYDVVQAIDPVRRITACPLGIGAHHKKLCCLHERLDDAAELVKTSSEPRRWPICLPIPTPANRCADSSYLELL